MLHKLPGLKVETLGDPHLGKRFIEHVPLHRRGERENSQWTDFSNSLFSVKKSKANMHVCMGDLFNAFDVPNSVITRAADLYTDAAEENPSCLFVVDRGNHDASRDTSLVSAFEIFRRITWRVKNLIVLGDEPQVINRCLVVPWHPFKTAQEMVKPFLKPKSKQGSYLAAFGHWDVRSYGQENTNLIPLVELSQLTTVAYTGHVHTPETIRSLIGSTSFTTHVVGSMQPYAHGEDPTGKRYVTLTLTQLEDMSPVDLKNKCVQLLLAPGEEAPQVECLQLTVKRIGAGDADLNVQLKPFDLRELFDEACDETGVNATVREEAWEKMK